MFRGPDAKLIDAVRIGVSADACEVCKADAQKLFKRLLSIRNDLGLLAEEYDPRQKRQQGNFPQAFSHVALINTAFNLTRADKPQEQRADGHSAEGKTASADNVEPLPDAKRKPTPRSR